MRLGLFGGVACGFLAIATNGALAQQASENRVATETDWSVFVESNPTECWLVSAPKETVNTRDGRTVAVRRGDILLMVSFRPASGVSGEIAFTGGYPFAKGSSVSIEIKGEKYELFTDGEWAWPLSPKEDAVIASAMKKGAEAVVTGRSGRGTITKDTFSLLGFTAAYNEAKSRCSG